MLEPMRSEFQPLDSPSVSQVQQLFGSTQRKAFTVNNQRVQQILRSKTKSEVPTVLRTLKINNLLRQFKIKLYQNAHLMPKSQKVIKQYLTENYLFKNTKGTLEQQSFLDQLPLPSETFILFWDCLRILGLLFSIWMYPFICSFLPESQPIFMYFLLAMIAQTFGDIIFQMNRPLLHKGEFITARLQIVSQYIKTNMFEDLISLFLLCIYYYKYDTAQYIREICVCIFLVINIKQVSQRVSVYFEQSVMNGAVRDLVDLVKLIFTIYFFAHIIACLWHYVGYYTAYTNNCWLLKMGIYEENIFIRYNYSFYWATVTMTTIGYGDITAHNNFEIVLSTVIMFCSTCLFGYSMNSIGIIVTNMSESNKILKQKFTLINQYMLKHHVNESVQSRVRDYLKFYIEHNIIANELELQNIVNILPADLKSDLKDDINMRVIRNIPQISNNFSKAFQKELSTKMQFQSYTPNEIIYRQGQANDYMYFIIEGNVKIFELESNFQFDLFKANHVFGQYQFFSGFTPTTSAVSQGFSSICKFKRTDLLAILPQFQKDYEKFHTIYNEIVFNSRFDQISLYCSICQSSQHLHNICPTITYQPNLEKLIKKQNFLDNTQSKHHRKRQKCNIFNEINVLFFIYSRQFNYVLKVLDRPQGSHHRSGVTSKLIQMRKFLDDSFNVGKVPTLKGEINLLKKESSIPNNRSICNLPENRQKVFSNVRMSYTQLQPSMAQLSSQMQLANQTSQKEYTLELDKFYEYDHYIPKFNLNYVVKSLQEQKNKEFNPEATLPNKYSFFYLIQQSAARMRRKQQIE